MKHISEFILEITQQQLVLQDRLNQQADLIASLHQLPVGINKHSTIQNIETELNDLTEFNCQINDSIKSVSTDLYQ